MCISAFIDRHRVTIKREIETRQPNGENKVTETTIATGVKCFVQPLSASEMVQFQKNGMEVTHAIYFDANPFGTVAANLHVVYWNGLALEVVGFTNAAGLDRLWKLVAKSNTHEQPAL